MDLFPREQLDTTNELFANLRPITVRKIDFKNPYFTQPTSAKGDSSLADVVASLSRRRVDHLYLHVPFCMARCFYCNYPKTIGSASLESQIEFLDELEEELSYYSEKFTSHNMKTIHIGGGTPNVLAEAQFERLLKSITKIFTASEEFAVELYPSSSILSQDKLQMMKAYGVDRVSIGIQTLDDELNHINNRIQQTANDARELIGLSKRLFNNVSIDLLYGQKTQTIEGFEKDLRDIRQLDVNSIYLYQTRELIKKRSSELQQALNVFLSFYKGAGYDVVSFDQVIKSRQLRDGFCAHRSGRSKGENLLGIGPGAVSEIDELIWKNVAPERYRDANRIKIDEASIVCKSQGTRKREYLNRALRHFNRPDVDGLLLDDYRKAFRSDVYDDLGDVIKLLESNNMLQAKEDRIEITDYGMLFTQQINYLLLDHYK